jgi:hypothetical protein
MNKTKEEIERIAEVVVDAMLKVHRALGPRLPPELERRSDQGRHPAHGQWVIV